MNTDNLSSDIKTVLDHSEPAENIKRQLQSRRVQVMAQAEEKQHSWSLAAVLMVVVLIMPDERTEFSEMAELSAEELEIMSTMDIEDLEEIEFYNWLASQEELTG